MEQPTQVFDPLDIDLVVKVLGNILLSPFFAFWIPLFYKAQGAAWDSSIVKSAGAYFAFVAALALIRWSSVRWRNGGTWLLMPPRLDWGEQIVVITGGSSGVGQLLAETFAVRNVTVVVLDVNPIITENSNIAYYKCDVSKWEEVEAVSKKVIEEIGDPTILVNNAGVVQGKLLLDLKPEDVTQTINTNLTAHFWTLKAFLPNMVKEKAGHIITVSSVMGVVGAAQMTDYAASKAALINLNESLRYELDKHYHAPNIRTTLVCPGHIMTPMFSHAKFPTTWLNRFLFPALAPHTVAKAIIAAVDTQESREICLPIYVSVAKIGALLPSWARDLCQWMTDADYTMNRFVKVTGVRPDEKKDD